MPSSIVSSGGITAVSSRAIASGLDSSADIDAILLKLDGLLSAVAALTIQAAQPIPQLLPTISGMGAIETPMSNGIPGKRLMMQFSAWYDDVPSNGFVEVVGSDGLQYFSAPLLAAKIGVAVTKSTLPPGVGFKVRLSDGGCTGFINYAIAIE